MQGRHHRPTKNAIRIALFASSTILARAWAIQLHLGIEGVKNQFTIFKNNENCTSETAVWALVMPLVVWVPCKAGTTNPPKTQYILHFWLLRQYALVHELLNGTLSWRCGKSIFPYKKRYELHLQDRNMGVGRAFGRMCAMQGRHHQPTKNAIRITLFASSTI